MLDYSDPSLSTLRIEITRTDTVHFYYKPYPKQSKQFPQERSYLVFYMNNELINESVLYEYFSLIKAPDKVSLGSFFNKKGSKKKQRIIYYAIVRFEEPYTIDSKDFQVKVNEYLETVKNRRLCIDFNPLKEDQNNVYDEEGFGEDQVDEDGFVEIKANNTNKDRFISSTNKDLSFKILKEKDDEDSLLEETKTQRKRKRNVGGMFKTKEEMVKNEEEDAELEEIYGKTNKGYYNVQVQEKQKRVYQELKSLFDQDKKIFSKK